MPGTRPAIRKEREPGKRLQHRTESHSVCFQHSGRRHAMFQREAFRDPPSVLWGAASGSRRALWSQAGSEPPSGGSPVFNLFHILNSHIRFNFKKKQRGDVNDPICCALLSDTGKQAGRGVKELPKVIQGVRSGRVESGPSCLGASLNSVTPFLFFPSFSL